MVETLERTRSGERHAAPGMGAEHPPRIAGGAWTQEEFLAWVEHHLVTAGARLAAREARRLGLHDAAEDLRQEWYVRLRRASQRPATTWNVDLRDEDAARAYCWVVLRRTAVDHWLRARQLGPVMDPPDEADREVDPVLRQGLDDVHRRLRVMLQAIRPEDWCSLRATTIGVALMVVEIGTGRRLGSGAPDLRGGSSEWDQLIQRAVEAWERVCGLLPAHRTDTALRQHRSRCGRRVRELLCELVTDEGLGGNEER